MPNENTIYKMVKDREQAILVSVDLDNGANIQDEIKELENLADACDIDTVGTLIQNLEETNPRTYIGTGKIEELKTMIASLDATLVIFNDELTPAQIENLEDILEISIFDRTYIILEIFKRRAKTKEAILQVQMASLKYSLPRLKGLRQGLSRQGGSGFNKGKGETQLEIDRRNIESRIADIKHELSDLTLNRQNQRKKRNNSSIFKVCLCGYTNSGKSTLLNAMLDLQDSKMQVFEKDMLFATLETQTKMIKTKNIKYLLTDTVGFISKLPHNLVEAFKSTLEEITEADLILHVIDSSNPNYSNQIKTTNEVLTEIGVNNIPMIYVFNKMDKIDEYFYIPPTYENTIRISAKKKMNLDGLTNLIIKELTTTYHIVTLHVPYHKGNIINMILENNGIIDSTLYEDDIIISCKLNDMLFNQLQDFIKK